MGNRTLTRIGLAVLMTGMLVTANSAVCDAKTVAMTPELAAKKEMVSKQQEQRITDPKRKTAAAAHKAERLKIYDARQDALKAAPAPN